MKEVQSLEVDHTIWTGHNLPSRDSARFVLIVPPTLAWHNVGRGLVVSFASGEMRIKLTRKTVSVDIDVSARMGIGECTSFLGILEGWCLTDRQSLSD
jgi:hypothetical protein